MNLYHHHGHEPAAVTAINRQREAEREALLRGQQCITGWRWALEYARDLIADMAALKGAQAFRGRIDTARHNINGALAASDMTVLRNSTSTVDLAIALGEAERAFAGRSWMIGHRMAGAGDYDTWSIAVFDGLHPPPEAVPAATASAPDPRTAVATAVAALEVKS